MSKIHETEAEYIYTQIQKKSYIFVKATHSYKDKKILLLLNHIT